MTVDIIVGALMVSLAAQTYDPETGLPMAEEEPEAPEELGKGDTKTFTEKELRQFIREEIRKSGILSSRARTLPPTNIAIAEMARDHARRDHNGTVWGFGGGLLSCGSAFLGGMIGGAVGEFPGFLVGAGAGAVGVPVLLATSFSQDPSVPPELGQASVEQQLSYRDLHKEETKKLRRSSIIKGELGIAAAAGIGLFILILSF